MSSGSEIAIKVENLSKTYRLYNKSVDRMKESLHPFRKKYHHDFYALHDISFEIKKGENFGIIGRNGSGKSTLLKIISGVLTPASGSVTVNGRISALLELGAGFNPEFTGVENVYFNGAIMGYSRDEMHAKLDEILSFADIGEFAYQPVKTYSSGMFVRLAFAVAVSVDPEILIVDEALAVGDVAFQMKCIDRINKMIDNGVTLIFVSHDPGAVKRLCKKAILLEVGNLVRIGNPEEVFDLYNAMLADPELTNTVVSQIETGQVQTISGSGEARVIDLQIINSRGLPEKIFEVGEPVVIRVSVSAKKNLSALVLGFMIKDRLGQVMFGTNTFHTNQAVSNINEGEEVIFNIKCNMNFGPGDYSISTALVNDNDNHIDCNYEWKNYACIFKIVNSHHVVFIGSNWIPFSIEIQ